MIDPRRVEAIFKDCLTESQDELIEGFITAYPLDRKKVERHRFEIEAMLLQLPEQFFDNEGGGWSALQMCALASGEVWTGLHTIMEQLFVLASAIGLAAFCLKDREMWKAMPGGMPYVVIYRSKMTTADRV